MRVSRTLRNLLMQSHACQLDSVMMMSSFITLSLIRTSMSCIILFITQEQYRDLNALRNCVRELVEISSMR